MWGERWPGLSLTDVCYVLHKNTSKGIKNITLKAINLHVGPISLDSIGVSVTRFIGTE